MQIFFTEPVCAADLPSELLDLPPAALRALTGSELGGGIPFVLRADGHYDHVLNRFFRKLPMMGVAAETSWRTYAIQLVGLARYIEDCCGRRTLLDGTLDDFESFKALRRDARRPKVQASSWNVQVAALDKFFHFALRERLIDTLPFRYEQRTLLVNGRLEVREVNALYESAPVEEVVRCLSIDEYLFFRDVGLGGEDGDVGVRTCLRNQALAELLVTTGMRITEALVCLREELPPALDTNKILASEVNLGRATTKGAKAREIWVSHRVLRDHVDCYIASDRADAVLRAFRDGRYAGLRHVELAERVANGAAYIRRDGDETKHDLALMPPARRRGLYRHTEGLASEPVVIWCSEDGLPLSDAGVRMSFRRACERCNANGEAERRFGRAMCVTPHTLRHTFAVAHLNQLIREAGLLIRRDQQGPAANDVERLRRTLMDPLDQLRRRLGHSSVETTYKYLTYLEQARGAAFAAVQGWDALLTRDRQETEARRGH